MKMMRSRDLVIQLIDDQQPWSCAPGTVKFTMNKYHWPTNAFQGLEDDQKRNDSFLGENSRFI